MSIFVTVSFQINIINILLIAKLVYFGKFSDK